MVDKLVYYHIPDDIGFPKLLRGKWLYGYISSKKTETSSRVVPFISRANIDESLTKADKIISRAYLDNSPYLLSAEDFDLYRKHPIAYHNKFEFFAMTGFGGVQRLNSACKFELYEPGGRHD